MLDERAAVIGSRFAEVLLSAKAGDERALGELYRDLNPRLLRYLAARASEAVDDLAQETWLSAAEGLRSFDGDERGFRSWFFTIAYRRVADHFRASYHRRERSSEPEALLALAGSEDVSDRASMQDAVRMLVDGLTHEQAEVVVLRVVADLAVDQVAEMLGKSPGAVRVVQHRALRRLARQAASTEVAS